MSNFEVAEPILNSPFEAGNHTQIAVKVVDDGDNELMVVKTHKGAK